MHSTVNIRLCLMLFLISSMICVCFFVFYHRIGIDFVQTYRRKIWTATDDDEYLFERSVVKPPSVEHMLPIRIGLSALDAVWQQVPETKSKLYVYSAHLDTRNESVGPLIRIIGTAKSKDPDEVWCRLWYAADGSKTVSANLTMIRENGHVDDTAVFVLCKLPPLPDKRYPSSVSVVANVKDPINNELTVLVPDTTGRFASKLEICVKPFHKDYDMETRFMEFVELNRLLGVEHFTFYNGSAGPNVQCVLNRYAKDRLIQILPWCLVNPVPGEEVGTQGQFAAFNDCLYRNMFKARYVAFLDVDEIIVPKHHDTLLDLIQSYKPLLNRSQSPAAYLFPHALFCTEWPDDGTLAALEPNRTESEPVVLRKTLRNTEIHEPGVSSKFICNPRRTIEVGNDFSRRFVDEERDATINVSAEMALLHDYKNCSDPNTHQQAVDLVADRTVYRYKDELVDGMTKTRDRLDAKCLEKARVRSKSSTSNAVKSTHDTSAMSTFTRPFTKNDDPLHNSISHVQR